MIIVNDKTFKTVRICVLKPHRILTSALFNNLLTNFFIHIASLTVYGN